MSMSDLLDAKLDGRFEEALEGSGTLDEALSKWLGIPTNEAGKLIDTVGNSVLEIAEARKRWKAELVVLRSIKPDATLLDFIRIHSLVSVYMADAQANAPGGKFDALLEPEPGESTIIMVFPNSVVAVRGNDEYIGTIAGLLGEVLRARTPIEGIMVLSQALELAGGEPDEAEEDTPSDEGEDA